MVRKPRAKPSASPADPGPQPAPAAGLAESAPEAAPPTPVPAVAGWPEVASPPGGPRCPWCSAPLAEPDAATCPSCGAQLNGPVDGDVPGVTTIDVAALAWKGSGPPRRNRIISWIAGDVGDPPDSSGLSSAALERPSPAVRREILRLELEAEGISLPHDAEPADAEEAAAVAESEADSTSPGSAPGTPGA